MNHAAPERTGPMGFTTLLSAVHNMPCEKTTCCMRSLFAVTSSSWLLNEPKLLWGDARKSRKGVGPGICSVAGARPYTSVPTMTLVSASDGDAALSDAVLVSAQTATLLSSVPVKSSELTKYSAPLLAVSKLPPGGTMAGCIEKPGPSAWFRS